VGELKDVCQIEIEFDARLAEGKIQTHNGSPPVPSNQFNWSAADYDYEPGYPVGYGATEAEAIADLRAQTIEEYS